jgi:uncharacterized membrane protein
MLRWVHIAAGLIAILAGFTALFAKKGSPLHRRAGDVFVVAMITLTGTAWYAATFVHPNRGNVVAAMVTLYLVTTAFLTVKRDVAAARGWYVGLMLLGLAATARAAWLGMLAVREGGVDKFPAGVFFAFGFVALSGVLLDGRLLIAGHIEGAQRLVRHLWRMGTGMWIATASLFLGQAKFFPGGDAGLRRVDRAGARGRGVTLLRTGADRATQAHGSCSTIPRYQKPSVENETRYQKLSVEDKESTSN